MYRISVNSSDNFDSRRLSELELDVLLDNDPVASTSTLTLTRVAGLVTQMVWADDISHLSLKSIVYTRTGGLVTSVVTQVFSPSDGTTVVAQKTETIVRISGVTTQVLTTRDV